MYPRGELTTIDRPFVILFLKPWFHIYGEYFMENPNLNATSTLRSSFTDEKEVLTYDEYILWISSGIYLLLTNIIGLNIVIAVFNNTYIKVH